MSENRPKGLGVLLGLFGVLLVVIVTSVVWVTINATAGDTRPWTQYEMDGDNVIITYSTGTCVQGNRVQVSETRDDATLTLKVDEGGSCDDPRASHTVTAVLKQPLAKRKLYDGACSEQKFRNDKDCANRGLRN